MDTNETTPAMVRRVLERLARNVEIARRRAGRPLTLSEKLLLGHLDDPESQELVPGESQLRLRPDRVVLQDILGQTALLQFMQTGMERVAIPATVHCDHLIQARSGGEPDLITSLTDNREVYSFLRAAAAKFGAGFWGPGSGIVHQVVLETYAFPGALILGTDSHTPNAGGLGACAVGVGGADAVEAMAGLPWELLYPRRIGVVLTGELSGWASPKDVILHVAEQLRVHGGTNAVLEYIGPGTAALSATGKATITNMGAEVGATTSVFPADPRMLVYLAATGRADLVPFVEQSLALLAPDPEVVAHPEDHYDRVLRVDLSRLVPYVAGPGSPDRGRPLSAVAAEIAKDGCDFPDALSAALIGSCTNSSYEDMSRAADVARQALSRGVRAKVPLFVAPGSERVRATTARDGQLDPLRDIGAVVLANACGPCIGQWKREGDAAGAPNTIVTSFNRNFPRRNDGQATTKNLLASPEIVTALALAGRASFNPLTDELEAADGTKFRLTPPPPAPEVPPRGFEDGRALYEPPPSDGRDIVLPLRPGSERLAAMRPWPAWDGEDFSRLPVLIKTRGKTTTDQISPAGPWLRYRGHLERFSDNLLSGAENAFTGAFGTGEDGRTVAELARELRARGERWVIVGDHNYGEGSSREHAALSPRLLSCAAVIARSFARIHETNLKKQGLLALTFESPADYERIRPRDRLTLSGLADMAPGAPVKCLVHHEDGTTETLALRHSYTASQVEWFRRGSALALCKRAGSGPEPAAAADLPA
ncbi:MAG: aconitate hydratase [Polyangiaceae bacterium]